ncbi:MAG: STAS-like domain-containing protein [Bacteroides xylanisolvens]|jgi:hypothetical protein|uniref:STAS-like domain-containing protein n=1 Tax=Bacteroides sp. TaxID=29523 RepID=UPI0020483DC6|nr:STAS-like domain-containing protein [Bacteroides sp.]DAS17608.1 MAG TPA: protein of unknown function DUF4325 [Caudoviricetes sp.]
METTINIAKEFSSVLGGRWERLGPHSGEEFYRDKLLPAYLNVSEGNGKVIIELDGTKGYPSSFLDQSFGELARNYGAEKVRNTIIFKTSVFQWVVDYINKEIWDKTK